MFCDAGDQVAGVAVSTSSTVGSPVIVGGVTTVNMPRATGAVGGVTTVEGV